MNHKEIGYAITTDPKFLESQNDIAPDLATRLEYFHNLAKGGKRSSIRKIEAAIKKYPNNPQLKNYLSVLYGILDEEQEMYDINKRIAAEHPDYLFGKLNLANQYFFKEEYDKIPEILGSEMTLKALYPNRDTFHLSEVTSFLRCAVLYFIGIENLDQAEIRLDILQEMAPDSPDTIFVKQHFILARMKVGFERFNKEQENKITVKTKTQEINTLAQAPQFQHPEIDWLYTHGLYIGEEKINKILSLPRKTLIQDLELVLADSIERYGYFKELCDTEGWEEETMNFVVHALFLLAQLKSTESKEAIFEVLSQSQEYLSFYLGDILTETIWEVVYKITAHDLDICKQFIYKPGVYTFARSAFIDVVEQLAHHEPKRRTEAIHCFRDLIQFFIKSNLEANVVDSDLIALLISSVVKLKAKELLPDIKKLYDLGRVSEGICGTWVAINKRIEKPVVHSRKRERFTLLERYEHITSTWHGYNDDEDDRGLPTMNDFGDSSNLNHQDRFQIQTSPVKAGPKVGRNEPCPCGSGKKYKKCCLFG